VENRQQLADVNQTLQWTTGCHLFALEASADAIYRGGGFERLAAIYFAAAAAC